ncbi:MAG: class I SAM-dependent methyltransferase [Acidobacteriota bacterium]
MPAISRREFTVLRLAILTVAVSVLAPATSLAQEGKPLEEPESLEWSKYYDRTADRTPREVLIEALQAFRDEGREVKSAVDAGCGFGVETLFLSNLGIEVIAFDSEPEGIAYLRASLDEEQTRRVRLQVAPFHEADWGRDVDLIFAGFALPFATPSEFPEAWRRLTTSLSAGGRFAGQLFGDRDDWAGREDRTHHRKDQAQALLSQDFHVEVFREVEFDGKRPNGHGKHWHYYEIIARKRFEGAANTPSALDLPMSEVKTNPRRIQAAGLPRKTIQRTSRTSSD